MTEMTGLSVRGAGSADGKDPTCAAAIAQSAAAGRARALIYERSRSTDRVRRNARLILDLTFKQHARNSEMFR